MMLTASITGIVILAFFGLWWHYKYRKLSAQLLKLHTALTEASDNKNSGGILLLSDETTIRALLVDINQLLEKQRSLAIRQHQQEERERRMIVNISHDLKTPLTVIYGYSEMLLTSGQDLPPQVHAKIERIYTKTQDVLTMIHVFFDLAKIESGDLPLKKELIDVCEICRTELAGYYEMLLETDCEVQTEIPEITLSIRGDEQALKRILGNLIQNAVRYGADGKYLKVCVLQNEANINIEVTDKGKGIVEENQDRIFERLSTLEDSRNKKYQGSGLGLTITKRLTEAMGGSIRIDSIPYEKTTFTVCFPAGH